MSSKNCKRKLSEISATDDNSEPIKKQRIHPEDLNPANSCEVEREQSFEQALCNTSEFQGVHGSFPETDSVNSEIESAVDSMIFMENDLEGFNTCRLIELQMDLSCSSNLIHVDEGVIIYNEDEYWLYSHLNPNQGLNQLSTKEQREVQMNLEFKTRWDKLKKWVSITDVCVPCDSIAPLAVVPEQTVDMNAAESVAVGECDVKPEASFREHDLFNSLVIPELAIKIFSYLGYKDLLLSAALVCKRWDGLSRAPELWRIIDVNLTYKATTETVEKLLKRSQAIKRVVLYECIFIRDSVVSEIAKQQKLKALCLARCYQLSPEIFSSVAKCKALRKLNLSQLPLTDDDLGMIAKSCTNLDFLNVDKCVDITTKGLLPVIQHCTQLRELSLAFCEKVTDDFLIALAAKPSQIECLFIDGCEFTSDGLKYLRKHWK